MNVGKQEESWAMKRRGFEDVEQRHCDSDG